MPEAPNKGRRGIAIVVLIAIGLAFAAANGWPHPRGIYGTDYGFPLRVVTAGSAANFDWFSLLADLLLAMDVLVLAGSILVPAFRKVAVFWIPVVVIQLAIAALVGLACLFVLKS